jgi:hypothetical protein
MTKENYQLQPISEKQFFDNWRIKMSVDARDNKSLIRIFVIASIFVTVK